MALFDFLNKKKKPKASVPKFIPTYQKEAKRNIIDKTINIFDPKSLAAKTLDIPEAMIAEPLRQKRKTGEIPNVLAASIEGVRKRFSSQTPEEEQTNLFYEAPRTLGIKEGTLPFIAAGLAAAVATPSIFSIFGKIGKAAKAGKMLKNADKVVDAAKVADDLPDVVGKGRSLVDVLQGGAVRKNWDDILKGLDAGDIAPEPEVFRQAIKAGAIKGSPDELDGLINHVITTAQYAENAGLRYAGKNPALAKAVIPVSSNFADDLDLLRPVLKSLPSDEAGRTLGRPVWKYIEDISADKTLTNQQKIARLSDIESMLPEWFKGEASVVRDVLLRGEDALKLDNATEVKVALAKAGSKLPEQIMLNGKMVDVPKNWSKTDIMTRWGELIPDSSDQLNPLSKLAKESGVGITNSPFQDSAKIAKVIREGAASGDPDVMRKVVAYSQAVLDSPLNSKEKALRIENVLEEFRKAVPGIDDTALKGIREIITAPPSKPLTSIADVLKDQSGAVRFGAEVGLPEAEKVSRSLDDIGKDIDAAKRAITKAAQAGDSDGVAKASDILKKLNIEYSYAQDDLRQAAKLVPDEDAALLKALGVDDSMPRAKPTRFTPLEIGKTYNAEPSPALLNKIAKKRGALEEGAKLPNAVDAAMLKDSERVAKKLNRIADIIESKTEKGIVEQAKFINTGGADAAALKQVILNAEPGDLKNVSTGLNSWMDAPRVLKEFFGKHWEQAKKVYFDPLSDAGGRLAKNVDGWVNRLKTDVIDGMGLKTNKEWAAIQELGEAGLKGADESSIVRTRLVKELGEAKVKVIEEQAIPWFRKAYDGYIEQINNAYRRMYPGLSDAELLEAKHFIVPRQDYFRHFRDLSVPEGDIAFDGIRKAFGSPVDITAEFAGKSNKTKPASKWMSILQKRTGNDTDLDAVRGFMDYVQQAEYTINISPEIRKYRDLAEFMGENFAGTKKYSGIVNFLGRYADNLSGKSTDLGRGLTNILPGSRATMNVIEAVNKRARMNTILMNAGASLSQIFAMPQGLAEVGEKFIAKGLPDAIQSFTKGIDDTMAIAKSPFITQRYMSKSLSKLHNTTLGNVKKFAEWMAGALDEVGTKTIWNGAYQKALATPGISDPIRYADDITRGLVAGRGIGEMPLAYSEKVMNLVAPFSLEVGNEMLVIRDMAKSPEWMAKLAKLFAYNWVFNRAAEQIKGTPVVFDPINSLIEGGENAIQADNPAQGALKFAGRQAGELIGNLPLGQELAGVYPEYGLPKWIPGIGGVSRKEFFGRTSPVRFAPSPLGMALTSKSVQDPLSLLLPPFGGLQAKKTIEGAAAYQKGGTYTPGDERMKYPIKKDLPNFLKTLVFGQYATPEAKQYFKSGVAPLGEKQTAEIQQAADPQAYYKNVLKQRADKKAGVTPLSIEFPSGASVNLSSGRRGASSSNRR